MSQEKPISIFFSYCDKDQRLKDRLETQLSLLKQQGLISSWCNRKIVAGEDRSEETNSHLEDAQIILLLISPDFIASDYCYGVEMKKAMERHESGHSFVIPIILRPVTWEDTPFQKLQVLPTSKKPVTRWRNLDEAFLNVANGIRNAIESLDRKAVQSDHETVKNKNIDKTKVNILIVEDNIAMINLIGIMFRHTGYNIVSVPDGVDAIRYIHENEFDLVLLDLRLPTMSGIKVIKHVRKQKVRTPIVIFSAAPNKEIVRGIKVGANGFVGKPFTLGQLFTVIESILGKKATVFMDADEG